MSTPFACITERFCLSAGIWERVSPPKRNSFPALGMRDNTRLTVTAKVKHYLS